MSGAKTPSIMITGVSGLLGAHVLRHLVATADGSRLVLASRSVTEAPTRTIGVPEWHALDLADPGLSVPPGVDIVVHVAGEKKDSTIMEAINHQGTRRLVQASAKAGVRRFVYVSSVGVYGVAPYAGLVDESRDHRPRNAYEVSKEAGEREVRQLCPELGIEYVVVQPTNVIGHLVGRSYPLLALMSSIKAGRFVYFGGRETRVNYICVEDVAAAIVAAARRGQDGRTYIVNTPALLTDLVSWISAELGIDAPSRRLPRWLGAAAARAGSALQRISGRPMPFNAERFLELTNTTEYDGRMIERELALHHVLGIKAAVRALVRAYRFEGRL